MLCWSGLQHPCPLLSTASAACLQLHGQGGATQMEGVKSIDILQEQVMGNFLIWWITDGELAMEHLVRQCHPALVS